MATESSIWFDYHQAIAQAAALEDIASSVERTTNGDLEDGLRVAAASWKGDNAACFQSKGARLQGQFHETARVLRSAASEVRQIAERTRRIELANLALIQNRTYQS